MPAGPPCDICREEPAVMSVMNLADHEQLLVGASCLLPYFQGMVGMLGGAEADAEATADSGADAPTAPPEDPPADPPAPEAGPPAAPPAARSRKTAGKS